jgi:hypothetical protein
LFLRTDIIIGYNSKHFDLPYIVMRNNYLRTSVLDILRKPETLNRYALGYGAQVALNSIRLAEMNVKCTHCAAAVNMRGVSLPSSNEMDCIHCGQIFCVSKELLANMECVMSSQWGCGATKAAEQTHSNGRDELPFSYHHDLINSQVSLLLLLFLLLPFLKFSVSRLVCAKM